MVNINKRIMAGVLAQALVDVLADKRWINEIARAAVEIETNPAMIWYYEKLLIVSTSGIQYSANGSCPVQAFAHGFPCGHRARPLCASS